MRDEQADLMARRRAIGLYEQAREAAVRSRAFGLVAEVASATALVSHGGATEEAPQLQPTSGGPVEHDSARPSGVSLDNRCRSPHDGQP